MIGTTNYALTYPRFWLWYFVASTVLTLIGSLITVIKSFGAASLVDIAGIVFQWIGLVPLYGYVRQRRFSPRWLWLILFLLFVLWFSSMALIGSFTAWSSSTPWPVIYVLLPLALGAPYLFALHQYVFRSAHIWRPT